MLGLLTCLNSCKTLETVLSSLDRPTARVTGVGFDQFTLESLGLVFNVEIQNPYAAPLPLVRLDYALASGGDGAFLQGAAPLAGSIPAGSSKTIQLPATVTFSKLLETVSSVKPGDVVPYTAKLKLSVDAPGVGGSPETLRPRSMRPAWANWRCRSASPARFPCPPFPKLKSPTSAGTRSRSPRRPVVSP